MIMKKIDTINDHILQHMKEQKSKRISKTVDEIIQKGGVNSTTFWDFVSKMKPKNQKEQEQLAMENN